MGIVTFVTGKVVQKFIKLYQVIRKVNFDFQELAEKFLDGNVEVEEYLPQYLELRKLGHLRKVKSEKMAELLRDRAARQRTQSQPQVAPSMAAAGTNNSWPAHAQAPSAVGNSNNWQGYGYGMPDPSAYLQR